MAHIKIQNLSLSFKKNILIRSTLKESVFRIFTKENNNYKIKALQDINTQINSGEKVGIIGSNGAGKSTLLKAICNIYEYYDGDIQIVGDIAPLLEIGAGFVPDLTGRENIKLNCAILGLKKKAIEQLEGEIISFSGLSDFIDEPVKTYSSGMYMRLAFTIASSISPEILILDEVFAGGDKEFIEKARNRIEKVINKANILILVSHDLSLINQYCTRVIWMDKGRIVADGLPNIIIDRYMNNDI